MIPPTSFTSRSSMLDSLGISCQTNTKNKKSTKAQKEKDKQASNGENLAIQVPWIGTLVKTQQQVPCVLHGLVHYLSITHPSSIYHPSIIIIHLPSSPHVPLVFLYIIACKYLAHILYHTLYLSCTPLVHAFVSYPSCTYPTPCTYLLYHISTITSS